LFRLIKLGISLVGLAAFAWFGVTVKLGSQTLFQHLRAIGQTKESQELVEGTRQAAGPLVDDVRRRFKDGTATAGSEKSAPDAGAAPPEERLSSADRQALRHLMRRVDR
jgi:hypothetical protein